MGDTSMTRERFSSPCLQRLFHCKNMLKQDAGETYIFQRLSPCARENTKLMTAKCYYWKMKFRKVVRCSKRIRFPQNSIGHDYYSRASISSMCWSPIHLDIRFSILSSKIVCTTPIFFRPAMDSVPIRANSVVFPRDLTALMPACDVPGLPALASAPSEPSTSAFVCRSVLNPEDPHCSGPSFHPSYKCRCSCSEDPPNRCDVCNQNIYHGTAGGSSTIQHTRARDDELVCEGYEIDRHELVLECPNSFEEIKSVSVGNRDEYSDHAVLTFPSQVSCR